MQNDATTIEQTVKAIGCGKLTKGRYDIIILIY